MAEHTSTGIDHRPLATGLQNNGTEPFDVSWKSRLTSISTMHRTLVAAGG